MKKILVLLVFFIAPAVLHAEIDLQIIKQIESSGNPNAVNGNAIGLYQITPIALKDFNQCNKKHYSKKDLHDPWVNEYIASWLIYERIPAILKAKGKPITEENTLIGFNCGVGCVGKKLPKETLDYLKKYEKLERALCVKKINGKRSGV